jgi:hypothetical protein
LIMTTHQAARYLVATREEIAGALIEVRRRLLLAEIAYQRAHGRYQTAGKILDGTRRRLAGLMDEMSLLTRREEEEHCANR